MKRVAILLLVSAVLIGVQGVDAQKPAAMSATLPVLPVQMATVDFVGDLHGIQAVANVSFEQLYNYVLMAGQIRSSQTAYMFRVDLVGSSGFGEAIGLGDGQRIPIRIDLMPTGFALTSNPFGPGRPSTYYFKRR